MTAAVAHRDTLGDVSRRLVSTRHIDTTAVALGAVVILASGVIAGLNLRQWSSLVGVVAVLGLTWRGLSTVNQMSHLARALTTALALNLAAGALAQYLLARSLSHMPPTEPPPPDNLVGNAIVIATRVFVIGMVIAWPRWLNRWDWPRRS